MKKEKLKTVGAVYTGDLKNKRGITLVALVVTVIILLILAGISIASLTGNGLFEKAKLAKEKQENAQLEEDEKLGDYENKIGEYVDGNRGEYENLKADVQSLQSKAEWKYAGRVENNNTITYPENTSELYVTPWLHGKTYPVNPTIIALNTYLFNHNRFVISGNQQNTNVAFEIKVNKEDRTIGMLSVIFSGSEYISNTTYIPRMDVYYK